jgi:hypothetical protein
VLILPAVSSTATHVAKHPEKQQHQTNPFDEEAKIPNIKIEQDDIFTKYFYGSICFSPKKQSRAAR